MSKLNFSELTPFQKKSIVNIVENKKGLFNPPSFIPIVHYNEHDFLYWIGGTELDRIDADNNLYNIMICITKQCVWWKQPLYRYMSYLYYKDIRFNGKKFFFYTDTVKTIDDVIQLTEQEKKQIRDTRKQ